MAEALAVIVSGSSPEQIAPTIGINPGTIRRWEKDPKIAGDSEVVAYVNEKIRGLAIFCVEQAEDQAAALQELTALRKAKDVDSMTRAMCTLIDKANLLTDRLQGARNVTPQSTSERNPLLVPHKTTTQDNDV